MESQIDNVMEHVRAWQGARLPMTVITVHGSHRGRKTHIWVFDGSEYVVIHEADRRFFDYQIRSGELGILVDEINHDLSRGQTRPLHH